MRVHGTLTKWNDERGFGFITPAQGVDAVFVHISAFPRGVGRPQLGEVVSYEAEAGHDGKVRAVRVMRPGQKPMSHRAHQRRRTNSRSYLGRNIAALFAIAAIGVFAYGKYQISLPQATNAVAADDASAVESDASTSFQCDGRTRCSQMTSCSEAKFFLDHCPNTQMDGDHDGVPCEQQWCSQ
jgi:cold shock CspA family protein